MDSLRMAGIVSRAHVPSLLKDAARIGQISPLHRSWFCRIQTGASVVRAAMASADPSVSPTKPNLEAKIVAEKVELGCPVCYRPLTFSGFQSPNLLTFKESSLRCKNCGKSYKSDRGIIDLVIPPQTVVASGSSFFQDPLIAFFYERGYRDLFGLFNFPGFDEEVICVAVLGDESLEVARERAEMAERLLEPARGEVIMDLSCGAGGFTRRFLAGGEYETVIASDFSQPMLEQCRAYLENDELADLSKVLLVRADAARLPFATASMAGIHAGAAIHCWPNILTSVAEISRILRPGGVFVASTFVMDYPAAVDEHLQNLRQSVVLPFNLLTERELKDTTEACGLVNWYSYRRGIYILFAVSKPI